MDFGLGIEEEVIEAFLYGWFTWPGGSVLTNLVASFLFAAPILWRVVLWARKEEKSRKELHAKIDRVHEHLGIKPE